MQRIIAMMAINEMTIPTIKPVFFFGLTDFSVKGRSEKVNVSEGKGEIICEGKFDCEGEIDLEGEIEGNGESDGVGLSVALCVGLYAGLSLGLCEAL